MLKVKHRQTQKISKLKESWKTQRNLVVLAGRTPKMVKVQANQGGMLKGTYCVTMKILKFKEIKEKERKKIGKKCIAIESARIPRVI
jgi:hypothetical protein